MSADDTEEGENLEELLSSDVEAAPNDAVDSHSILEAKIPLDIRQKYELLSYRNAAVILSETRRAEFNELLDALRSFKISTDMIRRQAAMNRTFQS
ncbi:MAG: hypothetical protein WBF58_24530 [Xanthobacteraceae bacterium]